MVEKLGKIHSYTFEDAQDIHCSLCVYLYLGNNQFAKPGTYEQLYGSDSLSRESVHRKYGSSDRYEC